MDIKTLTKLLRDFQRSLGLREINIHSPYSKRNLRPHMDARQKRMANYRKKFFRHEQHK